MNICILHIGFASQKISSIHQSSPTRFKNLLSPIIQSAKWTTISCLDGKLPQTIDSFDAYIITGGKYSVFDNYDWQFNLFDFISKAFDNNIPVVGVCYGHQAIAHVLGGTVERFDNGWGIGVVEVEVNTNSVNKPNWLKPNLKKINIFSMHQDQVTTLPKNAINFLNNSFCNYSGFFIDDRILTIQQHPEFTPELCRDLIMQRKEKIGKKYKSALETFNIQTHGKIVGQWITRFLKQEIIS